MFTEVENSESVGCIDLIHLIRIIANRGLIKWITYQPDTLHIEHSSMSYCYYKIVTVQDYKHATNLQQNSSLHKAKNSPGLRMSPL